MSKRTIVVMARPLVRGAAKSRLTRALGDDGALGVYERLLRETLDSAERVPDAALVLAETRPPPGRRAKPLRPSPAAAKPPSSTRSPAATLAGPGWSNAVRVSDGGSPASSAISSPPAPAPWSS